MFAEFINLYGTQILEAILVAIFGCFGLVMKRMAAKYLNDDTKQTLAKTVVCFVEQVYKDLHGHEKLQMAMKVLSDQLAEKNIKVTGTEMKILIEAAVAEFNEAFKKPELAEDTAKATYRVPEITE